MKSSANSKTCFHHILLMLNYCRTHLKTAACCPAEIPNYLKSILSQLPDEILCRQYGCGSPIPLVVEGCKVLDLGCGTGKDVYTLSALVGTNGHVFGLDMTESQILVGEKYKAEMKKKFGFKKSNVTFLGDTIENLDKHINKEMLDIVISNCVLNLVPDASKKSVFQKIHAVLKKGGELYFSDIYCDRRIPNSVKHDKVLYGECLGGAIYTEDFRRIASEAGFLDIRLINSREIEISDSKIKEKTGNSKFFSVTYRLWKHSDLEDRCEDYGQVAIYNGGITHARHAYSLDFGHVFHKGKPELVCMNTAKMLSETRLGKYFTVSEPVSHFGLFKSSVFLRTLL